MAAQVALRRQQANEEKKIDKNAKADGEDEKDINVDDGKLTLQQCFKKLSLKKLAKNRSWRGNGMALNWYVILSLSHFFLEIS